MRADGRAAVVAIVSMLAMPASLSCTRVLAPQPDTTRFYVLTPDAQESAVAEHNPAELVIGVGPVRLPGYLDRPQFVTRTDGNRVTISEFDRWAEPLHEGFARVLGQNLASRLDAEVVSRFPWPVGSRLDYQIELDVIRFEADDDGAAELTARWSVKDGASRKLLITRKSTVEREADGGGTPAAVAALSGTLGELASEIAGQVRALASTRRPDARAGARKP